MNHFLISGCSRGLGFEMTQALLKKNKKVHGTSRTHPELKSTCFQWSALDLGLTDIASQLEQLPEETDVLILSAARGHSALAIEKDGTDLPVLWQTNYFSQVKLVQHVARNNIAASRGTKIVLVSSLAAHLPMRGLSHYSSTKKSLENFCRGFAHEMKNHGVELIIFAPDYMATDMTQEISLKSHALEASRVAGLIVENILDAKTVWDGKVRTISNRKNLKDKLSIYSDPFSI